MAQTDSKNPFLTVPQLAVLTLGAVLFVLLLLADKSNLSPSLELSPTGDTSVSDQQTQQPAPVPAAALPAFQGGADKGLLERLKTTTGEQRQMVIDSLCALYLAGGRPDLAFVYVDPHSNSERIQAGRMAIAALQLSSVFADSGISGSFARNAAWHFGQVLKTDSVNQDALMGYGIALINAGGPPTNSMNGIQSLVKVTKLNPNHVEAFMQLGLFSLQTGQYDKARERFEHILELRPEQDTAMYYLANAEFELGNIPRSKELLQKVIQTSDNLELVKNAQENLKSLPKQ